MLFVAILMAIATMPGQTVLVALYNASFREALGLSVTQLSAAYTIGTIIASLPLPWVGRFADRVGLRLTVGIVAVCFALSLLLLREATGVVMLGFCFFLVRFLGQGSLSMLAGHVIAMWFERKLGRVHALLAVCGFAVGSAVLPQPIAWLIAHHGWQFALLVSAAGVLLLTMPMVIFVFRNTPEDIGQHLDGDPVEHAQHDVIHGGTPPPGDPAFTVRQAVRTPAFWILVPNMLMTGLVGTALIFHMQTMLQQAGLEGTERQAALAIQAWPIVFGVATLIVGWLTDKFRPSLILPVALVLQAAAELLCLAATRAMVSESLIVPLMATGMGVYGASQATIVGVCNPSIARFFGRTHHGAIRGVISTAIVLGTGAGPIMFAVAYDLSGNDFTPVMLAFVSLTIPLGIAAAFLTRPDPPAHRDLHPDPDEPDPIDPAL